MTSGRARRTLLALLLVGATLAVYAQTLRFDFISFDDPNYVTENAMVQAGLTREGVGWALTTRHAENWHPLTWMSHMLDCELFGLDPAGHHATNVLLHVLNALLLFLLLAAITGADGASAFVAGMFALHPLHVESVAWVAERKDLLSTFFGLLALCAYVHYARRPRVLPYVAATLLLGLSLCAKPMLVTLPLVCLLLDLWPLGRLQRSTKRRLVLEKLPMLGLVALLAIVTLRAQAATESSLSQLPLGPRLANAVAAYAAYLRDALWPTDLCLFYPHPWLPGGQPLTALEIGTAALALVALSALVAASRRPYALVGWFWFLGTLVPVLGLVQVGFQARADRYTYLPLVGIWIAVAFGFREWSQRPAARRASSRGLGAALGALIVAIYGLLAWGQARHWSDSISVYSHAIRVEPRAALMHSNLAAVYMERGEVGPAREHFEAALELNPDLIWALGSLGVLLRAETEFAQAAPIFRRALALKPDYHVVRANLAWSLAALGKLDAAEAELRLLLAAAPEHALGLRVLGMTREARGDLPGAREAYARSMQLEPDAATREALVRAATRLGRRLLEQGRPAEALVEYERALGADPEHPPALRGREEARAALAAGGPGGG